MKSTVTMILAAIALSAAVSSAHADTTLMSDSLNGSGALAGSAPAIGSGTWETFYADNGAEVVPNYQNDTTGAGFPAAVTTGMLPIDGTRSSSGVNVGAFTSHTDDGAYIAITPAATGAITANGTFTFPNIAASSNPTAWAFIGLDTSLSTADVILNTTTVGPWLLVRPASNGTDVVELYATGGTGHQVTTTNTEVGTTGPHSMQLFFDPSLGTLNASVDGKTLLTTAWSYSGNSVAVPTVDGFIFGNRTNTGLASAAAPSTTFLSNVSVTQAVPEPASMAVLAVGAAGLLARRRRA